MHNKDILFNTSIVDIKAITLDLDDTLWPVAPTIAGAEQDLFDWLSAHAPKTADLTRLSGVKQSIRQEVTAKHHARAHDLGFLRREMIRESLRLAGDDPSLADDAYAVFDVARQRVTLFHGVEQALARLALKYRLVAISNGTANVFVTPAGPYFDAAFSAHEVGVAKPSAKIYHAATTYLGLSPEQVLHIGDDAIADVWGAKEAGLQTVWINPEGHLWAHQSPQPWTVRDLAEVADGLQV
jgi:FMN hydrolase / 5-amino-6-(5-phospho-D-ribitylamino)uracil phosphatase